MPFDGNGNYTLPTPANPAVSGAVITAANWNTTMDDLANALSNVLCRDGQAAMEGNLPAGGFKLTGLGAGTASGDSVRYDEFSALEDTVQALSGVPRARASVASQACADSTQVVVVCSTETFDVQSGYNSSTGKYTAPVSGYYSLSCMFQFPIGVDQTEFTMYLYINGVLTVLLEQNFSGTFGSSGTIVDTVYLAAGEYAEFKVLQSTGGSKNLSAYCSFLYLGT